MTLAQCHGVLGVMGSVIFILSSCTVSSSNRDYDNGRSAATGPSLGSAAKSLASLAFKPVRGMCREPGQ